MKEAGLLCYDFKFKSATNVGDYIQSLAAKKFLPNNVELRLINREELKTSGDNEVFLIMNGWFSHKTSCWPPSDKINPLFISFHLNSSVRDFFKNNKDILSYLKKHEPIGCRDTSTRDFLISNGINAYFSSCLTTTLNREDWTNKNDRHGVLFIDVLQGKGSFKHLNMRNDINGLGKILRCPKTLKNKINSINANTVEKKILRLIDNKNIKHMTTQFSTKLSESKRFELAESFLNEYANAELVITSRIHVALPCLAFGTPVLFINPGMDTSRFPGLDSLFNIMTADEVMNVEEEKLRNIILNLKNKTDFIEYRDKLKSLCNEKVFDYFDYFD
ncbi:polysaccharide pyruvyl transferase family protein [Photobacterium leiognathi]|uniref:polysaccharide pyruvyl transferase family protein n=1 Tax=Photobacterium leiognathi TaxID=553611 RepID=UPI0029815C01|nr:polysaccharide pyruvyl transferase family protein [Photobacterium leiognathi]